MPSKGFWRERTATTRHARTPGELAAARAAIAGLVLSRAATEGWRCVCGYDPLRTEPGSVELLNGLVSTGVRVLVPVTLPDRDLDWTEWGSSTALGPDAIGGADAVLVPASAVAGDGTRLGRGGGSYDRALPRRRPDAPAIALVFDDEIVDDLPRDEWDVPVTDAVHPEGWLHLGS